MEFSRPVVLVHGAWHGAWCWATFQAELDRRGITSYAIDLPGHGTSLEPLGGLDQDAAHLATILDHLDLTDAVLVGHSYGGAVITQAAAGRSDLAHLVYVTAFALNAGESVMGALRSLDPHDVDLGAAMQFHSDGTSTLDPRLAVAALYGSCSPEAIAAALPRLSPQPGATMTQDVTGTPRNAISSTYVRCLQDRAIHPEHQAVFAARCTAQFDLDTDHSPFVSMPVALADIVDPIARPA
jgi:pimeloyl-ACP methyl ester carboxylesterase|tara:strand:- start:2051 stop:2770 length:720 start_codon:yes stop_codon:yes gene_type:complete